VRNTEKSRQQAPSSFDEPNMDIGVYFAKKRPHKQKKVNKHQNDDIAFFTDYVSFKKLACSICLIYLMNTWK
jgi:hypothetical protein